jgi:hypothetical protein
MAMAKFKIPNLLDDLVLNFDPFSLNGLEELNAPSPTQSGAPIEDDGPPTIVGVPGPAPAAVADPGPDSTIQGVASKVHQIGDVDPALGLPYQTPGIPLDQQVPSGTGATQDVANKVHQIGDVDPALGLPYQTPGIPLDQPVSGPSVAVNQIGDVDPALGLPYQRPGIPIDQQVSGLLGVSVGEHVSDLFII